MRSKVGAILLILSRKGGVDMDPIQNFEAMLAAGKDSAMLRFGLANAYLKAGDSPSAVAHLRQCVILDSGYSAAWKLLGKALTAAGQSAAAITAYEQGIAIAQQKGDLQAAKEMRVFLKRLQR